MIAKRPRRKRGKRGPQLEVHLEAAGDEDVFAPVKPLLDSGAIAMAVHVRAGVASALARLPGSDQ